MADLLLLAICLTAIPMISATFLGSLALPFLDASRPDARDLYLAIKDLALPLGSLPSKLLEFRISEVTPQVIPEVPTPDITHRQNHDITSEERERQGAPNALSTGFPKCKNIRLSPINKEPHIYSAPINSRYSDSAEDLDDSFVDAFEYQTHQHDEVETEIPKIEGDTGSEVIKGATEVFNAVNQAAETEPSDSHRANEEPDAPSLLFSAPFDGAHKISEPIATDLSKVVEENEKLEDYIRQVADPRSGCGLTDMKLGPLIRWVMQEYERRTNELRMENNQREDEIYAAKQVFEDIIIGQNVARKEMDTERDLAREEASELALEINDLRESNKKEKDDREERIKDLKDRLRTALEAARQAKATAEETTAGVDSRISKLQITHAQAMSAAASNNRQEQNSLICSRRMVEDNLRDVRRDLFVGEQQHEAAIDRKNSTITELKGMIKQLRSSVTTSEMLAASTEQRLEKRLDDQRKEKDSVIATLNLKLRELKNEIKTLSGWKNKAEAAERNYQRLSDRSKDEISTLRDNKEHIIARLKLDIQGLERTIKKNGSAIAKLRGKIVTLESGQEVKDLKSQLGEAQQQLQRFTNEVQGLRERLHTLDLESAGLRRTIEAGDQKIKEAAETAAREKEDFKQQLEQATRVSDGVMKGKIQKLEEEKKELARKLENALEAEQKTAEDIKSKECQQEEARKQATEDARREHQKQIDNERELFRQVVEKATDTENDLRCEITFLKSQFDNETHFVADVREMKEDVLRKEKELESEKIKLAADVREKVEEILRKEKELESGNAKLAADVRAKEEDILRKEKELESGNAKLADDVKHLDSRGRNLKQMKTRAEKAENEVLQLQVAAINAKARHDSTERDLTNEIEAQERGMQRLLDLLNEETSRTLGNSRVADLHNDLQGLNLAITCLKYDVTHVTTDGNVLSKYFYGADLYESDVHLLQAEKRHVLLAQLQAARR